MLQHDVQLIAIQYLCHQSDIVDDVMEIVSVDTKELHREGHGSRNIQAMIAIARLMKLKIWGVSG